MNCKNMKEKFKTIYSKLNNVDSGLVSDPYTLQGDDFCLDFRRQEFWGWKIAFAFFFGDVGAGFFLFSSFYNFYPGMILGWIMATFFKPAALFMHLGQPLRFWRAAMHPGSSWITRGFSLTVGFSFFGLLHMLNYSNIFGTVFSNFIYGLTIITALGTIIYLGFVLSYSPAIKLWNSGLMPIICLNYGLLGGVTLLILFGYHAFLIDNPQTLHMLKVLELGLVLYGIILILSFLHGAVYSGKSGKISVKLLFTEYKIWFVIGVIGIGLILTAILMYSGSLSIAVLLTIAIAELIGDIGFKITLFKTGTYEPVLYHS